MNAPHAGSTHEEARDFSKCKIWWQESAFATESTLDQDIDGIHEGTLKRVSDHERQVQWQEENNCECECTYETETGFDEKSTFD